MARWQENAGHLRMGFCASMGCSGKSIWQLQAGDVWSDYCAECRSKIDGLSGRSDSGSGCTTKGKTNG